MNPEDKLRDLLKAKFISKKRGKSGKWVYEYAKSKGEGKKEDKIDSLAPKVVEKIKKENSTEEIKKKIDYFSDDIEISKKTLEVLKNQKQTENTKKGIIRYETGIANKEYFVKELNKFVSDKSPIVSKKRTPQIPEELQQKREKEKKQDKTETMSKAQIEPWRLSLMKVDNRV